MVYLGLTEGWLSKESLAKVSRMHVHVRHTESQKSSVRQGTADVNKMFKKHGGSVPVATMYKLDPNTVFYHDIILMFGEPVERWSW